MITPQEINAFLLYHCEKCGDTKWISLAEAQTPGFFYLCDLYTCRHVNKVKTIRNLMIEYGAGGEARPSSFKIEEKPLVKPGDVWDTTSNRPTTVAPASLSKPPSPTIPPRIERALRAQGYKVGEIKKAYSHIKNVNQVEGELLRELILKLEQL